MVDLSRLVACCGIVVLVPAVAPVLHLAILVTCCHVKMVDVFEVLEVLSVCRCGEVVFLLGILTVIAEVVCVGVVRSIVGILATLRVHTREVHVQT